MFNEFTGPVPDKPNEFVFCGPIESKIYDGKYMGSDTQVFDIYYHCKIHQISLIIEDYNIEAFKHAIVYIENSGIGFARWDYNIGRFFGDFDNITPEGSHSELKLTFPILIKAPYINVDMFRVHVKNITYELRIKCKVYITYIDYVKYVDYVDYTHACVPVIDIRRDCLNSSNINKFHIYDLYKCKASACIIILQTTRYCMGDDLVTHRYVNPVECSLKLKRGLVEKVFDLNELKDMSVKYFGKYYKGVFVLNFGEAGLLDMPVICRHPKKTYLSFELPFHDRYVLTIYTIFKQYLIYCRRGFIKYIDY